MVKSAAKSPWEVFRAHDTKFGRDVAIKVLPEAFASEHEQLARFRRETHILASLNHPNIAANSRISHSPTMSRHPSPHDAYASRLSNAPGRIGSTMRTTDRRQA